VAKNLSEKLMLKQKKEVLWIFQSKFHARIKYWEKQKNEKNEICIYAVISSLTISYGQITAVSLYAASKVSIKINLLVSLRFNSYTWVYEPALLSAADS
jgi:hypothetical protein